MKYKVNASITNASKLLFRTIVDRLGGSTKVGNQVGLKRQAIHNFEVDGYVPLKIVYSIAKELNLKPWHLSFYKLVEVHGTDAPPFEGLVNKLAVLSPEDKVKILKAYKKK